MNSRQRQAIRTCLFSALVLLAAGHWLPTSQADGLTYVVVDTGQDGCYDTNGRQMTAPEVGEYLYGQDAQYAGNQPAYRDNGNGTVTDMNSGLVWQQNPPTTTYYWDEALSYAESLTLAGKGDWRLPTIKELLSLADFNGNQHAGIAYIDTSVFGYHDPAAVGQNRDMDGQYWSSTESEAPTMQNRDDSAFGFNFADGRIKAYPKYRLNGFVRCVRGGSGYGENDFDNNGDGTITDRATGLMWTQADSTTAMNWPAALEYAESFSLAGYDDWRLPNAKELQSIVDYTRATDHPNASRRSAAIDPIFDVTVEEAWCWTGTTLLEAADTAIYIAFGRGTSADGTNIHGSGCLRSDPKVGDPADYPNGRGPQNDEIRIYNHVRLVRDAGDRGGDQEETSEINLAVAAIALNQKVLSTGDVLKSKSKIVNRGQGSSVRSLLTCYLSRDNNIDAGDVYLGNKMITSLDQGEHIWIQKNYRLPTGLETGLWTLIVVADEADLGQEQFTGNNTGRVRIRIQ